MMICFKTAIKYTVSIYLLDETTCALNNTFFRLVCLKAKVLSRIIILDLLVDVTEPKTRTLKRFQLRIPG